MDEKTYGGYTVEGIRQLLRYSEDNGESIDDLTGDGATSAGIISGLLQELFGDA